MDNITICRMRRMSKYMSSFVELNRKKIAARPYLGIRLGIGHCPVERRLSICYIRMWGYTSLSVVSRGAFCVESNFKEKLSAISIKKLCIVARPYKEYKNRTEGQVTVEEVIFELLNMAYQIRFVDQEIEDIVKYLKLIKSSRLVTIEFSQFEDNITEKLEALSLTDQNKKLWIKVDRGDIDGSLYENTKGFYGFTITTVFTCSTTSFGSCITQKLLAGNLQFVLFNYHQENFDFEGEIAAKPRYETFWELDSIPKNRLARFKTPKFIHKMDLQSNRKCAIIAHYMFPRNIYGIFIIDNNPSAVFECLMKNLGLTLFDPNVREKFLNRGEKSAQGIFTKIYLNHSCFYKVPLDCLTEVDDCFTFGLGHGGFTPRMCVLS